MIRTQISVDEETYQQAKALAARRGISLAELCRQALGMVLAKEPVERPWTRFAGILEGNPRDSETVDEVVYGRNEP